jgi:hypothetical protein
MSQYVFPSWVDEELSINTIVRISDEYVVWIDDEFEVDWKTSSAFDVNAKSNNQWAGINLIASKIASINALIPSYFSSEIRKRINIILAEGLVSAFEKQDTHAMEGVNSANRALNIFTTQESRKLSLQTGLIIVGIYVLFLLMIVIAQNNGFMPSLEVYSLAIGMSLLGGIGAYFSVLTKNGSNGMDTIPMKSTLIWEMIFRIVGGTFFGFAGYLLVQTEIISFKRILMENSVWASYFVAIASGFSERFIPSLISSKADSLIEKKVA